MVCCTQKSMFSWAFPKNHANIGAYLDLWSLLGERMRRNREKTAFLADIRQPAKSKALRARIQAMKKAAAEKKAAEAAAAGDGDDEAEQASGEVVVTGKEE